MENKGESGRLVGGGGGSGKGREGKELEESHTGDVEFKRANQC